MPNNDPATGRERGPATGSTPDARVARWVRRLLTDARPRASSLIVTVWGDALAPHGGTVWLSTLIGLVAPFGISERLVRTSVFRLARDGWLAAEAAGRRSRYRLTAAGAQRFAQAYRRVYTPPAEPWDGRWDVVLAAPDRVPAAQRRPLRAELAWAGFGEFAPGTWARPARVDDALPRLSALLDDELALTVFCARDRDPGGAATGTSSTAAGHGRFRSDAGESHACGLGPGVAGRRLSALPGALRQRRRGAAPAAGRGARSGADVRGADVAGPRIPARAAARSAAAGGAAARGLAGGRGVRAGADVLPSRAAGRGSAPGARVRRRRRGPAAGAAGVPAAVSRPRLSYSSPLEVVVVLVLVVVVTVVEFAVLVGLADRHRLVADAGRGPGRCHSGGMRSTWPG